MVVDSTLEGVGEGEDFLRSALQRNGLPEEDRYRVLLAVREVLVNAARHGNGFDPADVPDPIIKQNLAIQSGCGLPIARSVADEVTISRREPRGTLVRLLKRTPA